MDKATKIAVGSIAVLFALACGAIALLVGNEANTFASNEKIIADALAKREARMTPAERAARDQAQALAAEAAAKADRDERERQSRESFLPSARGACLVMLQRLLQDPGSAEFGLTTDWPAIVQRDGKAVVLPRIRAKNGFGALRIAEYRCVVERAGLDQVRVLTLDPLS